MLVLSAKNAQTTVLCLCFSLKSGHFVKVQALNVPTRASATCSTTWEFCAGLFRHFPALGTKNSSKSGPCANVQALGVPTHAPATHLTARMLHTGLLVALMPKKGSFSPVTESQNAQKPALGRCISLESGHFVTVQALGVPTQASVTCLAAWALHADLVACLDTQKGDILAP